MKEKNSDELITKYIKDGLDHLDASVRVNTPDMNKFRSLVKQVEEGKRVRRKNETFLFMLSAAVILSLEVYAFNQSFISFAVTQGAALIGFPLYMAVLYRKQKRKADVS